MFLTSVVVHLLPQQCDPPPPPYNTNRIVLPLPQHCLSNCTSSSVSSETVTPKWCHVQLLLNCFEFINIFIVRNGPEAKTGSLNRNISQLFIFLKHLNIINFIGSKDKWPWTTPPPPPNPNSWYMETAVLGARLDVARPCTLRRVLLCNCVQCVTKTKSVQPFGD